MQNKKPSEIILHVGRVTSLQSWVAKKSCHGQTLINECFIFDQPLFLTDLLNRCQRIFYFSKPTSNYGEIGRFNWSLLIESF